MPTLVIPRLSAAYSARESAREHADDALDLYRDALAAMTDADLPGYVEQLIADSREYTPRPSHHVPVTHLWWVDDDRFLGRLHLRHRLTPFLRESGGHAGYHVIVPERRRGHATAMLRACLPVAAALGLECLLVTCDQANLGSRRVIEAAGGLFQDQRLDTLRFWVPTS